MLFEPDERPDLDDRQQAQQIDQANCNGVLIGAFQTRKLIGYVSGQRGIARRNRHVLYLVIGVERAHQGQRVGTGLLESVEAWAVERSIRRMELTVVVDNRPAIGLYRARGFTVEGVRHASMLIDGRFRDELYMGKLLQGGAPSH